MSFTSYAPNFEDVTLWRALAPLTDGVYVNIDTCGQEAESISRAFYERGWKGVHVVADSQALAELRRTRSTDVVIEARIGLPAQPASQAGAAFMPGEGDNPVPALTLDALFDRLGPDPIHWMRLVLRAPGDNPFQGWCRSTSRPCLLLVTYGDAAMADDAPPCWEAQLLAKGYRCACVDGINRYYVAGTDAVPWQRLQGLPHLADWHTGDAADERYLDEAPMQAADLPLAKAEREVQELQRKLFDAQAAILAGEERAAKAELEMRAVLAEAQQIPVLQRQLQDVYASTSWQVTKPMRWVSRLRRSPGSAMAELGVKAVALTRRVRSVLLNRAINLVLTRPWLKRIALRVAQRFPGLLQRYKPQIKVVMSAAPAPGPSNPATVIGPRFRSLILDELQRLDHPSQHGKA